MRGLTLNNYDAQGGSLSDLLELQLITSNLKSIFYSPWKALLKRMFSVILVDVSKFRKPNLTQGQYTSALVSIYPSFFLLMTAQCLVSLKMTYLESKGKFRLLFFLTYKVVLKRFPLMKAFGVWIFSAHACFSCYKCRSYVSLKILLVTAEEFWCIGYIYIVSSTGN